MKKNRLTPRKRLRPPHPERPRKLLPHVVNETKNTLDLETPKSNHVSECLQLRAPLLNMNRCK